MPWALGPVEVADSLAPNPIFISRPSGGRDATSWPPLNKNDHEGILLARFDLGHPEAKTIPTQRGRQEFVNFKDPRWIELD